MGNKVVSGGVYVVKSGNVVASVGVWVVKSGE